MRRSTLCLCLSLIAAPVAARPGFYVGLGIGGSSASGTVVPTTSLTPTDPSSGLPPPYALTTDMDGGFSSLLSLGYNILGYGAVETRFAGHGHDLDDANLREWGLHWHTGIRAYPLWHWQKRLPKWLQPLEPSLFVGWGTTYQGYPPPNSVDEVGWRTWSSWRYGLAAEYFLLSYLKVALDYSYVRAPHNRFIYDFSNSLNFYVEPTAVSGFHQFFVVGALHFGSGKGRR